MCQLNFLHLAKAAVASSTVQGVVEHGLLRACRGAVCTSRLHTSAGKSKHSLLLSTCEKCRLTLVPVKPRQALRSPLDTGFEHAPGPVVALLAGNPTGGEADHAQSNCLAWLGHREESSQP